MGATPADTEREISQLRGDMTAAIEELERRVRGGLRGIASTEARISTLRTQRQVAERARENPTLLGVAGVVAAGAVGYALYRAVKGLRERNEPQNRLRRRVRDVRHELGGRVEQSVQASRKQLERARPRGLLLKLDPDEGGYVRVTDARLDVPAAKKRGQNTVIKKLVWAGLLSLFMALGSVFARRVAGTVWQAMTHEEPPTEKSKVR
ncbi:MAG: hypothetical protein M3336_13495 [Chloroflexota bacterium]|nr:hypothetical protein [Chloroflexota bacterium]